MRLSLLLITLLISSGCNPGGKVTEGSSAGNQAINQDAPYIWGNQTFPKIVKLSPTFSADEQASITAMANQWTTSVPGKTWMTVTTSEANNNFDLEKPDSAMGIYKATSWPGDISNDALAVTQLFGRRYNIGKASEYVSIVHADIIMNYGPDDWGDYYSFYASDTDPDLTGYDLKSIMLHEMGHFLGLQHIPLWDDRPDGDPAQTTTAYKRSSVMYPFIQSGTGLDARKRIPTNKDITALTYKYNLGGSGSSISTSAVNYEPGAGDNGESTKIVIELRKSGECLHKENGAVTRRHFVKLK